MIDTKSINDFQSYDFEMTEERFGYKHCKINYYFYGEEWRRVWEAIKLSGARPHNMLIFAGAKIQKDGIKFAGEFKKHLAWEKFREPLEKMFGSKVKLTSTKKYLILPSGSAPEKKSNDSIKIYVDNQEITSTDWEDEE